MEHIFLAKSLLVTGKKSQIKVDNPFDITQHILDTLGSIGGVSGIDAVNGLSFLNSPANTQIGLGGTLITDTVINGGNFNLELSNLQGLFFEGLGWVTSHLEVELKGTNSTSYLGDIRINSNLTDLRYSQTGVGQTNIQLKPAEITISIEDTSLSTLSTYNLPKNEPESGDIMVMNLSNQLIFKKNYQTFSMSQLSTTTLANNDDFNLYIPVRANENYIIESVTLAGINTASGSLKLKYDIYRALSTSSNADLNFTIAPSTTITTVSTPRTVTESELIRFRVNSIAATLSNCVVSINGYYVQV